MIAFREEVASVMRDVEAQSNLIAERMRSEGDAFDLHAWGEKNMLIAPGIELDPTVRTAWAGSLGGVAAVPPA